MTMEIEQAVPIGTSMLHYLGESAMQIEEGTANTGAETPQTSLAARIDASAPLPCLLISLSNNTNKRGNVKKPPKSSKIILLHGPPGSGKTSLAMNLAYSCAANFNLCRQSCGGTANACRCVAVTIFRHISKEREDFPPFCRKITGSEDQDDDDDAPNDFASRYQKLTDKNDRPNVCDDWETVILRRIQVHYVSSAREILKELLSLLGKPLSQHPCRAIILDDLDLITASTTNYSDPTATATTSTMQTCMLQDPILFF